MKSDRNILTVVTVVLTAGLLAGAAGGATLVSENFQSPTYANGTANPAFAGWTYNNSAAVKSRLNPATSDLPGGSGNQGLQLEWDSGEALYTISTPTWNAGDVLTLTLDVAPQSWNGSLDRYIAPSLIQGGSTKWSANTLMNKWSGTPTWEQKQYIIPTTGFTSGTNVTLKIDHTGQRGIYFDNVNLTVDAPPADNDPPLPNPPTWKTAPLVFDYTNTFMSVNPASDPFGVEYRFTNTTTGNNSGWQAGTEWVDSGLNQNANYNYQVVARDKSPNQNATSPATGSATTGALNGLIFSSGFEYPEFAGGTANPGFSGWVWTNGGSVRAQSNSGDGLPGGAANQAIQFEWNNAYGTRPTSHGWSADEIYTISLNVAPQQWGGTSQRYFQVTLLEPDGTMLWGSGNVALPLYNNFGGSPWPAELTFSFNVDGSLFSSITGAAQGSPLSLRVAHPTGQRGIYVDNVMLTFARAVQDGTLRIVKFLDLNGDGVMDGNETFLSAGMFQFEVFDAGGTLVGTFPNSQDIALPEGLYTGRELLSGDWSATTANPFQFAITAGELTEVLVGNTVPEPATMALLSLAAAGLGGYVRRRRAA